MAKLDYIKRLKIKNAIVFRSFKILVGISSTVPLFNLMILNNLFNKNNLVIHIVIQENKCFLL